MGPVVVQGHTSLTVNATDCDRSYKNNVAGIKPAPLRDHAPSGLLQIIYNFIRLEKDNC